MKKILFMLVAALFLLGACDSGENTKENKPKENAATEEAQQKPSEDIDVKQEDDIPQALTGDKLKEVIDDYALGEEDKLTTATLENDKIKVTIELAPNELLSNKDLAVTRYSQASDELLNYEGWKVLTITYTDVGTISMDRSEKETNEYDMDYFPTAKIEQNFK